MSEEVQIDWVWHAGKPQYGVHATGAMKNRTAAQVSRPYTTLWRADIPCDQGWVVVGPFDTFEELEQAVIEWYEANPPEPPPPKPDQFGRKIPNRPPPPVWPPGAEPR